jgi:glutamate/tyrosine decarboxylase-like PLP-dependent enzyme
MTSQLKLGRVLAISLFQRVLNGVPIRDRILFTGAAARRFPGQSTSRFSMWIRITKLARMLALQKKNSTMTSLFKYPANEAVLVWQALLRFSPNNLGNWSTGDNPDDQISGQIEAQLITQMSDLYGGTPTDWEGYFTTGGTEGNILCAWQGRNQALQLDGRPPVLIVNSLTHYSVLKAGDLLGLTRAVCPIGSGWSFDISALKRLIMDLQRSGHRSILLPLTMGYTSTGTSDEIGTIANEMEGLNRTSGTAIHIWVDAALSGMIEPFTNPEWLPCRHELVNGLVVDFHKYAGVPYPAGLVLYRKPLRKLVDRYVEYFNYFDSTLLGSRPGVAPIATWYMVNRLGRKGYLRDINEKLGRKKRFIDKVSKHDGVKVATSEYSLHCGVVYDKPKDNVTADLERMYGLHFHEYNLLTVWGERQVQIARAYFL